MVGNAVQIGVYCAAVLVDDGAGLRAATQVFDVFHTIAVGVVTEGQELVREQRLEVGFASAQLKANSSLGGGPSLASTGKGGDGHGGMKASGQ